MTTEPIYTGFYPKLKTLNKKPDYWFLQQQKITDRSLFTADIFLNGASSIVAIVLHNIHGYPLYALMDDNSFIHMFCKKDDAFIDIRGITNDFSLFIRPFAGNNKENTWKIEDVVPIKWEQVFQHAKTFHKENYYELEHIAQHYIFHTNPMAYRI